MTAQTTAGQSLHEAQIEKLYRQFLDCWNKRDAHAYAALIAEDGNLIGFDGSQMNGRLAIEAEISRIFTDHQTSRYVSKVREVRFLASDVAILRAVVGMVPPGQADIKPDVNAIQTLVAIRRDEQWQIAAFQNTPAQFHGRPELAEALTAELRQLV